MSDGRLFHTSGAHTLKERLENSVLVLGNVIKDRVDDLSEFKYTLVTDPNQRNVRTASGHAYKHYIPYYP